MTDLADLILAQLAKATSQQPAKAEAVRLALDVPEAAFTAALTALERECRINTAHIRRKGDTDLWLALWPTGLRLPNAGWTGNSHRGLFVSETPILPALRAASAPRTRPTRSTRKAEEPAMPKAKPKPAAKVATQQPAPPPAAPVAPVTEADIDRHLLAGENRALRLELDRARAALRLGAGEIAELAVLHLRGDTNELSRRLAQLVRTFPPLAAMQTTRTH